MNQDHQVEDSSVLPNNISVNELDEETNKKLRGDAIGDTLYSESFVIKTLLQFSDLKWSDEIEEDLCFLWDMTVEKDVCKFLFEISYPPLACSAVMRYTNNRFIEIVIGILANILCADCSKNITVDEINIILREMDTDDHLVLVQVVRFISAVSHISRDLPFITSEILDKINFILCNSTNEELLLKTLEAVGKLTIENKLDKDLINIDIIKSSFVAYKMICNDNNFELDTQQKRLVCKYMLEIVCNFCTYISENDNNNLLSEFKKCSDMIVAEVIKILNYFSHIENMLPVTDDFIYYMSVFKFVLEILDVHYMSNMFIPLIKILDIIIDIRESVTDLFETVLGLASYLIKHTTTDTLYNDLNCMPKKKVKRILEILNDYKNQAVTNVVCN